MKHSAAYFLALLLMATMLVGCGDKTVVPEKGDFSFSLPEGYSIASITDTQCDIIHDDSGTVIGGIAVTDLRLKDLKDENIKKVMQYLRTTFHKTNRVEFCSMNYGEAHPGVSVNVTAHYDDNTSEEYWHYFFEKELGVYHLWFDMSLAEQGIQLDFKSVWYAE